MALAAVRRFAGEWLRASYAGFLVSAYAWWAPLWLRMLFVAIVGALVWFAAYGY